MLNTPEEKTLKVKVSLFNGDISQVKAEGLVCPVDGAIAVLGGPAAATALKRSFPVDERDELFGYLEEDVKRLRPIRDGEAKIIPGEGKWDWLVVIAALPYHVNDTIIGEDYFADILEKSIISGIRSSVQKGIKSMTLTVIGSSIAFPQKSVLDAFLKHYARVKMRRSKLFGVLLTTDK